MHLTKRELPRVAFKISESHYQGDDTDLEFDSVKERNVFLRKDGDNCRLYYCSDYIAAKAIKNFWARHHICALIFREALDWVVWVRRQPEKKICQ